MKYLLTKETAIRHLKELFFDPTKDALTLDEVYVAGKKTPGNKKHKSWFKNELAYLRQYQFIEADMGTKNGLPIILGIHLTQQGKIALKRIPGQLTVPVQEAIITKETKSNNSQVEVIAQVMTRLKQENQNQRIVYKITEGTISIE